MAHAIRSYVKGQLVEVLLPVYTGVRQVRAALIISLGLGPNPGETRLALTGGAHVDVTKAWMQKNAPQAGKHYFVQDGEGNGVAHPAEAFEGEFADQATPPAPGGPGTDAEPPASGPEVVEGKGIPVTGTIGEAPAVTETVDSTGIPVGSTGDQGGLPSAADLDVVAELQKAADATSSQADGAGSDEAQSQTPASE